MTGAKYYLSSTLQHFEQFPSLKWLFLATFFSVSLLISYHYVYTDLNVDSGSYSYPAYAISVGGDPNENQNSFEAAPEDSRLVVLFAHFTKNTVRAIPLSTWFSTFEPSIAVAKAYSMLEMVVAWAIFALCAWRISGSKAVFFCLSLLFILDTTVIDSGVNDLRPDLFTVLLALFALFFLSRFYDDDQISSRNATLSFAATVLFCFLLALTHPVSVVSLSVMLIYASLRSLVRLSERMGYIVATLMLLWFVSVTTFLLRGWILDSLLPSEIAPSADLWGRVGSILQASPLDLVRKEYRRWSGYLLWENLHLLLLFAVMLIGLVGAALTRERRFLMLRQMPLTLASSVGVIALLLLDPHADPAHASAVAPFLLLAASELKSTITKHFNLNVLLRSLVITGCVVVTAIAAYHFYTVGTRGGETNHELQQRLRSIFSDYTQGAGVKGVAFGPAELWPYIGAQPDLLIFDHRSLEHSRLAPYIPHVDYAVVNDSYRSAKFMEKLKQAAPDVTWVPLSTYSGDPTRGVVVFHKQVPN